jgi:hypothetical protein
MRVYVSVDPVTKNDLSLTEVVPSTHNDLSATETNAG